MEGEQKRRRKIEGEERTEKNSSKAGAKADIAMTISVAKKANVKNAKSELSIFLFSFLIFIFFSIYFFILFLELGLGLE